MSYPGSKGQAGVWQRIIGQMPPHSLYVEPFAGSGQIFLRKRPAASNVLIDVDAGVSARLGVTVRNAGFGTPGRALVDVIHGNGIEWLNGRNGQDLTWSDNALIYCDPPYVLSTRLSRRYSSSWRRRPRQIKISPLGGLRRFRPQSIELYGLDREHQTRELFSDSV